jgi:SAM-dependent methyltransferase
LSLEKFLAGALTGVLMESADMDRAVQYELATDRWTSGADYDRWMGRWSCLLAQEFLGWLNVPDGCRWIDICCGSGVLTETIVERASPASVMGVDASPEQIDFARRHRASGNIAFEVANAMSLPFADASFDVAVCGLGLNYLSNPLSALEEFQRVVRSGGTVAAYVWDYENGARFVRAFWDAAIATDPNAAAVDQARRFPICRLPELSALFAQANLQPSRTHALDIVTRFTSFDDYWEPLLGGQGSAPNYLISRDQQTQAKIRDRLKATLPADRAGAIELSARAWAIRGQRP